jgi:hypothetical protein
MNKIIKKIILLTMFIGCCSTLFLTWTDVHNVQSLDGTSILTGNLFLSLLILGTYCSSVVFYEKAPKVFFCTGLSGLSMLFAIMLSKFENWGRFANRCVGPYAGLSAVILTTVVYVGLNIKETKEKR